MPEFPSFDSFYAAVNGGRAPFPWQQRLAEQVVTNGWPEAIGVPTGLGKTASLDIAVWALASQHSRPASERTLPTRIWYVVNRRLLVDTAYQHGLRVQRLLECPTDADDVHQAALRSVGDALRSMSALGSEHGALHTTLLRGGVTLGARVPDPSQPALIFATVPMFASRWLFQGYGCSRLMRPIEAALAGIDSMVLLDESHVARPLRDLRVPVAECDVGDPAGFLPASRSRPQFVELTATSDPEANIFDLDEKDRAHPEIQRRLRAAKPTRVVETNRRNLSKTLAEQALSLIDEQVPQAVVVFVNTARGARDVSDKIAALIARKKIAAELILLTGRIRDWDAEALRDTLLDPVEGAPAGRQGTPTRNLIVVATQTLEVGADLDFDALVTETAGTRALVQRFGRLNRLGHRQDATAVICHPMDQANWPVYGTEPAAVFERLREAEEHGRLELGPEEITRVLGDPQDRPPRVGELLPVHLWEWAKTSAPPPDMAPIEPFVEGFDENIPRVTVAWRAYVPDTNDEETSQLFPRLRASETVELPIRELRDALIDRDATRVHRVIDGAELELVAVGRLRPGDQVILPIAIGLYDVHGWNPAATEPVLDISPLVSRTLVLEPAVIGNLLVDPTGSISSAVTGITALLDDPDADALEVREAVTQFLDHIRERSPKPSAERAYLDLLAGLLPTVEQQAGFPPHLCSKPVARQYTVRVAADVFDELSFTAHSTELNQHLGVVGELAGRIAAALGCSPELATAATLAGEWHDRGKADPRFQRWLDPDSQFTDTLLAKSDSRPARRTAARIESGWPHGGRHELLSARLLLAWLHREGPMTVDDALLVHLVASHHGHGRPSTAVVTDPTPTAVSATIDSVDIAVSGDLNAHDWTQPTRFRLLCEQYGYWGLALLETVLRQADHAASSQVEEVI